MANDLIGRLRFYAEVYPAVGCPENGKMFKKAADKIEALQAENALLKSELAYAESQIEAAQENMPAKTGLMRERMAERAALQQDKEGE